MDGIDPDIHTYVSIIIQDNKGEGEGGKEREGVMGERIMWTDHEIRVLSFCRVIMMCTGSRRGRSGINLIVFNISTCLHSILLYVIDD